MNEQVAGWSIRTLARRIGVPASTVGSWVVSGLITPEHAGRGRQGHTIGISGLLELLTIVELRSTGFSMQSIRKAVQSLRVLSGQNRPLARLTLVVQGKDITWKETHELEGITVSALQQPGQSLMVFPMGSKYEQVLKQLLAEDAHISIS